MRHYHPLLATRQERLRPICFALMIFLFNLIFSQPYRLAAHTVPQDDKPAITLAINQPIEQTLNGNQAQTYQINLAANQYLYLVVDQRGIDVVVRLFAPDGNRLVEVDSPNGTQGAEPVRHISATAGTYRLEVRSLEKDAPAGRYEVKIIELRAATESDRLRLSLNRALADARQLKAQRHPDALQKALARYAEALPLTHSLNDKTEEISIISEIGNVHLELNDYGKALDTFTQMLTLSRSLGNADEEASALNNIGAVYYAKREYDKALDYYEQALKVNEPTGNRKERAAFLQNLGDAQHLKGDAKNALESLGQSLLIFRDLKDRKGEAQSLGILASVYIKQGDYLKARDNLMQALPLFQALGDPMAEAVTTAYLADVYIRLGESQKAINAYTQALNYAHSIKHRRMEAAVAGSLGQAFQNTGELKKALEYYQRSLEIGRELGDRFAEAMGLNNLAAVAFDVGEFQKALDYYDRSLALRIAIKDRNGQAEVYSNVGTIYQDLGEHKKAIQSYEKALPIFREEGYKRGEANLLNNFGVAYRDSGEYQKALGYYEQSVQLWRAIKERRGEALVLRNLGSLYQLDLKDYAKALEQFEVSLKLSREVGDRTGEIESLHKLGSVSFALKQFDKALDYLQQSLALGREVQYRRHEVETLSLTAKVERALGKTAEAATHFESAIQLSEALRGSVASRQFRSTFLSTVQYIYTNYIDLLMQLDAEQPTQGYAAKALQISERTRARGLLELLTEARADIRQGVDAALLERERTLRQSITARANSRIRLLNGRHTKEQLAAATNELETLNAAYQEVEAKIRQTSPRYAALTQMQTLTLAEIQQLLDDDTLLLEYTLSDPHSFLWLVTTKASASFQLANRTVIEGAARRVYELLTAQTRKPANESAAERTARLAKADAEYPAAAAELSRLLLAPVASQLGNKRLVIVTDGALQYIPFAALPEPTGRKQKAVGSRKTTDNGQRTTDAELPLMIEHEIVNLPSASTLALLRRDLHGRPAPAKTLAVFADPVFEASDIRVKSSVEARATTTPADQTAAPSATNSGNQKTVAPEKAIPPATDSLLRSAMEEGRPLGRLPYSRKEALGIAQLVAPASQKKLALDFEANYQSVTSGDLSAYRFVHFATHGLLDTEQPELSGILLSLVDAAGSPQEQGILRLGEIYNLKLPVEMVVLSACQTALGKSLRGEGLIGLTRGFMYAGAPRVVASLWEVNDAATAELMKGFYEGILVKQLRPAAALRRAQLALWQQPNRRAPYFWSAFVLQGEWR